MADPSEPREKPPIVTDSAQQSLSIALYSRSVEDALATIRVLGPAEQAGMQVIRGVKNGTADPECVQQGDIVLLQRDFSADLPAYEEVLRLARALGKPLVLDLDDLLVDLSEDHPDRLSSHFVESLLPIMQSAMEADLITVPTEALRGFFLPYNPSITVLPNYLNDVLWQFRSPREGPLDVRSIKIGYMGGHSHAPDLELILPALLTILDRYPGKVRFHFWGIQPPVELQPFSQVDWCPPDYQSYADFVAYLQTQAADILVAPLRDNPFNACKSQIKYLEYAALGAPGVFSRVTPYANLVVDGQDGFLAASTAEWVDALSALIENPALRRQIAVRAQEKTRKDWLLSKNANRQREIYTDLLERYDPQSRGYPPIYPLVRSLARQIQAGFSQRRQQLSEQKSLIISQQETIETIKGHLDASLAESASLKNKLFQAQFELADLRSLLAQYEDEIVSYATSRSWQLTRPFRIISRRINRGDSEPDVD